MAMGNKTSPGQFSDRMQGMMPPAMSLPSAADPRAAARAAAAAAAGAKQKQLEVAASASNNSNVSARAQAAEEAKRQQKRLEAAAQAEAAQQAKERAEQAALETDSNRRQQLLEAAKQDALNRAMQLERAARAQEAGSLHPPPASVSSSSGALPAQHSTIAQRSSAVSQAAPVQQTAWGQANSATGAPTVAKPSARSIDGHAWPAMKPAPGVATPAPAQNVWGAVPSSILKAPAPVEEKKPSAQLQKVVKTDNTPHQKNAWGNIAVGRKAEVKPGTVKPSAALQQSPSQTSKTKAHSDFKSTEQGHPETDWEGKTIDKSIEPEWQSAGEYQEGMDAESVARAQKMLDDFLRERGMQQQGLEDDPWGSENVQGITEDSNDTDEVFFMRPNGVSLQTPQDGWESEHHQPAPVKPSAWALGAPRIATRDEETFGEGFGQVPFGGCFGQGFEQVNCPEGLGAFELTCDDGSDMFADMHSAVPTASVWGVSNLGVQTKGYNEHESNSEDGDDDEAKKSPSVALRMMLGIGFGGATLPDAALLAPPVARKLPVWGKPDGKMDISMDPAIAQIAKDRPPPVRAAMPAQEKPHSHGNGGAANGNPSAESSWGSKPLEPPKHPLVLAQEQEDAPFLQTMFLPAQQSVPQQQPGLPQHFNQLPVPSNMMQTMSQLQGPSSFSHSGPSQEQRGETNAGGDMSMPQSSKMPTPEQIQQMQPQDILRHMQGAGDMVPNIPGLHQGMASEILQGMASERPDSMFPFGMPGGIGGLSVTMGGPGGSMGSRGGMDGVNGPGPGGGLNGGSNLPGNMMQPGGQGMQNMFGMGIGSMVMNPIMPHGGPRAGDNHNLPPWMQHQQHQHQHQNQQHGRPAMGMGGMGFSDTAGGPNWAWIQQQHQQGQIGLVGNNRPGMGMGPMAGLGPGGGADMLKMMGGSSAPPGNLFQQGHGNPNMRAFMGGHGAAQPPGLPSGFDFAAFAHQGGVGQPGGGFSCGPGGGGESGGDGAGGGFDFNKVFCHMSLGGSAGNGSHMPQMPSGGLGAMPGAMMSLAGIFLLSWWDPVSQVLNITCLFLVGHLQAVFQVYTTFDTHYKCSCLCRNRRPHGIMSEALPSEAETRDSP